MCAPILVLGLSSSYGKIFLSIIFRTKLHPRLRYTCAYAARIFEDVARGKWRPKFPKSFMLLAIIVDTLGEVVGCP